MTDDVRQQIIRLQQDETDSSTFRTRTVNQPPVSLSPPKLSELSSRADTYHMIPIERMDKIRQETAQVLDLGVDGEQQSKIKKTGGKKKKATKKRRPSTRLRRRAAALAQAMSHSNQGGSSNDDETDNEDEPQGIEGDHDDGGDDDDDDEPFIIKQSSALSNGFRVKSTVSVADSTSGGTEQDV